MPVLSMLIADTKANFSSQHLNKLILSCPADSQQSRITDADMEKASKDLGIEFCVVKAISENEAPSGGFQKDGDPTILFEPHKMWSNLKEEGYSETELKKLEGDYGGVLYKKQGAKKYGKYSQQWSKMNQAAEISPDAAIKSASWGKFQVLGEYYADAGYSSPQEMMAEMCDSEAAHLKMFTAFVKKNKLQSSLKNREWDKFSKRYNGPSYKKNKYDEKLSKNYTFCKEKEKAQLKKLD